MYDRGVGHREQLLDGARQCLLERGYARTTARDIVAASGTNLASIGYHFGSKEALLTQAMVTAIGEWAEELARVLATACQHDPLARFEAMIDGLIQSFQTQPNLWKASLEITAYADHSPQLKQMLADATDRGREGLARIFLGTGHVDDTTRRTVGAILSAIITGIYTQWSLDPESAPSSKDFATGIHHVGQLLYR
jgi:AcrR family transcriptional regulator